MTVHLLIDEISIDVEKGTTVLQAARQNDVYIPTLCDFPGLPSHGSCRMCIVEIQGRMNTPTACTTLAEEGMVIQTNSPKVQALRAELLQMLLAEHPSSCLFCPEKSHCDECMVTLRKAAVTTGCRSCSKDNQCELQGLVEKIGLSQADYPVRYRLLATQKNDPFLDRDNNLCILCGRCIRVCAENHFSTSIDYAKRGSETLIGAAFGQTLLESGCSFCGACVEVCPTGALSEKTRKWDGIPDQETITTCPFCSAGCQVSLLSRQGTVIGSLPAHQAGTDNLCVKGRFGITELVNHPSRLKRPQKKAGPEHLFISWDETIRLAAEKCSDCPPDRFKMIISGDCSVEDLFVAGKFTRDALKSDQIYASSAFLAADDADPRYRLLKKSHPLNILTESSAILHLGLDGDFSESVAAVKLHQAQNNGAKLIAIDSGSHRPSQFADLWLRPLPGQELNLLHDLLRLTSGPDALVLSDAISTDHPAPVLQASQLMKAVANPVIVLAPSFFNTECCAAVEQLSNLLNARVIIIPEGNHLVGNLTLASHPQLAPPWQPPQVLYLIGENIPAQLEGQPFILYQNITSPDSSIAADLILPMVAFSETGGTRLDISGQVRQFHPAVPAPGEALPSWQILARIAQKMGVPGFDYQSLADVQTEMASHAVSFAGRYPSSEHGYMGFPLTRWVEGLRWLVPPEIEETRNAHVHNS